MSNSKDEHDFHMERLDPKDSPWYGKKLIQEHTLRYTFARAFVKNKVVVDLGCGTGYGTQILALNNSRKIYGVDSNAHAIEYAQKHYSHKKIIYKHQDGENTKLPSSVADVVVAFEIIEHVENPKKFLKEASRLLKPGGTLFLSTPNNETSYGDNPYHVKEYSIQELKKMVSEFPDVTWYGQRRVNRIIISLYKKLAAIVNIPVFRIFLRFRPWENPKIEPLKNSNDYTYHYIVAVCKKGKTS